MNFGSMLCFFKTKKKGREFEIDFMNFYPKYYESRAAIRTRSIGVCIEAFPISFFHYER